MRGLWFILLILCVPVVVSMVRSNSPGRLERSSRIERQERPDGKVDLQVTLSVRLRDPRMQSDGMDLSLVTVDVVQQPFIQRSLHTVVMPFSVGRTSQVTFTVRGSPDYRLVAKVSLKNQYFQILKPEPGFHESRTVKLGHFEFVYPVYARREEVYTLDSQAFEVREGRNVRMDVQIQMQDLPYLLVLHNLFVQVLVSTYRHAIDFRDLIDLYYPAPQPGASMAYYALPCPTMYYPNSNPEWIILAHEVGHYVMYRLMGPYLGSAPHSVCMVLDPTLAFSEGYADAFAFALRDTTFPSFKPVIIFPGITEFNVELYSCHLQTLTTDEGRVAAALWDVYDGHGDNNENDLNRGRSGHRDDSDNSHDLKTVFIDPFEKRAELPVNDIDRYWDLLGEVLGRPDDNEEGTVAYRLALDSMIYNYLGQW